MWYRAPWQRDLMELGSFLTTLSVPRSSVHQAVIAVTNALFLKLDFKVGIYKSSYT